MIKRIVWEGRTSPLLYIYEYLGVVAAAYLAQLYFGVHLLTYSLVIVLIFTLVARSMKYVVYDSEIYFSRSFVDDEETTIGLTDIHAIHVIDRKPWSIFNLGTLIFVIDPSAEMQPCMKCVHDPKKLAESIRRRAQALGSSQIPIYIS